MQAANAVAGSSSNNRLALLLQLAAAIIVAAAVVIMLTPLGAGISPDSILYLDIATHIRNGLGVTSTDYALAHAGEGRAVPNTAWPPLYPALLALGPVEPGAFPAATWSAILLAATLFFTQRILGRFLAWPVATVAALPLAIVVPMLTIHTYAWSEQLFIAILVALLLVAQRHRANPDRGSIALAALLLVLAFYTRYIGIVFLPLLPLLYLLDGRPRQLLPTFMVACAAAGLAVAALLAYNLHVGGSMTGVERHAADTSLIEQLGNFASALVPVFLSPGRLLPIGLCVAAAVAIAFGLLYVRRTPEMEIERERRGAARLALGLAAYYAVCLVALRSAAAFDEVDVRLLGVAVPYLWIGCVALIAGFAAHWRRIAAALPASMVVAALAANGYFVLFEARANWLAYGDPGFLVNFSKRYSNYNLPPAANPNREFMASRTDADSILVTRQPQIFSYTTGLRAFGLPAEFSAVEIEKLAGFPARSYIIASNAQRPAFEAAFQRHGFRVPEVSSAGGNAVLLHLPLERNDTGN